MSRRIAGQTLGPVLQSIREITGPSYPQVLRDAQLERFEHAPPPPTSEAVASEDELANLFGALYRKMGESLTRSMLTGHGNRIAPVLLARPETQKVIAAGKSIPSSERLSWAVKMLAQHINETWTEVSVSEDRVAFYLDVAHCPVCSRVKAARDPFCASTEVIFTQLVRAFSDMRVGFIETACAGQGSPRCQYRLLR